jgi:dUTP pyrophosphatase
LRDAKIHRIDVQLLHPHAKVPERAHDGDAGYDLRCLEPFALSPGARATVPTGVAIALPVGVAGLVVPRSGSASKHGLSVVNGPGLIDPGYRGEIKVVLINLGEDVYTAEAGDKVAQLLLVPFVAPELRVVAALDATQRGERGFGSSGR